MYGGRAYLHFYLHMCYCLVLTGWCLKAKNGDDFQLSRSYVLSLFAVIVVSHSFDPMDCSMPGSSFDPA